MISVFTIPNCIHCKNAKNKLKELNIPFDEVESDQSTLEYLREKTSQLTMPVIFFNDKVVTLEEAIKLHNEK